MRLLQISEKVKNNVILKKIYDLRSSNVSSFVNLLSEIDWSFLHDEDDSIDVKCNLFSSCPEIIFTDTVPTSNVRVTSKSKPWITPFIVSLINKRWNAFRSGKFDLYNHLKRKVKLGISRSKISWAKALKANNLWSVVSKVSCNKSNDPMIHLYNQYNSVYEAACAINNHYQSV